jgi:hypothetical protein
MTIFSKKFAIILFTFSQLMAITALSETAQAASLGK